MKKIGNDIIEPGINIANQTKERITVRAVIKDLDKVFMLYSNQFNDYTFPGGGVKTNEDRIDTLKRELLEEIGSLDVEVIKPIGYTVEYRYGTNSANNVYKQTSYYYLCNVGNFTNPKYDGKENDQGLETRWVYIDDAINHNDNIMSQDRVDAKGFQTVLVRENSVLEYLKEFE